MRPSRTAAAAASTRQLQLQLQTGLRFCFQVRHIAAADLADALGGRIIRADELLIDLERRRVTRAGKKISLTPTEFEILRLLAEKPGRVFSRRDLLERVRDYDAAISGDEKTINVHVSHLRDKVEEDPSNPRFVMTVRGVGYAFADRSERGERSGS